MGVAFYYASLGFSYALTLGSHANQNQIFIGTQVSFDSVMIFVAGAIFSAGLSMLVNLIGTDEF